MVFIRHSLRGLGRDSPDSLPPTTAVVLSFESTADREAGKCSSCSTDRAAGRSWARTSPRTPCVEPGVADLGRPSPWPAPSPSVSTVLAVIPEPPLLAPAGSRVSSRRTGRHALERAERSWAAPQAHAHGLEGDRAAPTESHGPSIAPFGTLIPPATDRSLSRKPHRIVATTGLALMVCMDCLRTPAKHETIMRIHPYTLTTGITRSEEFERKMLATHAVNCGLRCGHDCLYCSSVAMLRCHKAFKELGEDPFGHGYAIVDLDTPERLARDAQRIKKRGMVQLCTLVDAWAPEAQQHDLGRRCLEAILSQPGWTVRVLTKNAAVRDEFDLIREHRDRVFVGLSITATPDRQDVIEILEPNASPIHERMAATVEAAARGLRTYAMFCPLLPGIADTPDQIDRLVKFATDCRVEEIFVEPVNPRGPGLRQCQEALELWGYDKEAEAIQEIRHRNGWSRYVAKLLANVQQSVRRHFDTEKLRFLLYPSCLLAEDKARIREDDQGVMWLREPHGDAIRQHDTARA